MNCILAILISGALAYTLGYRLGVKRGNREHRLGEYRRGFRNGYDQARSELSDMSGLEDEDLLRKIRNLRESAGK
jgi:hypothetical protein